jgi:hypothetical protein
MLLQWPRQLCKAASTANTMLHRTYRIFTVSKGCVIVTAPQAAMPPAMKALR